MKGSMEIMSADTQPEETGAAEIERPKPPRCRYCGLAHESPACDVGPSIEDYEAGTHMAYLLGASIYLRELAASYLSMSFRIELGIDGVTLHTTAPGVLRQTLRQDILIPWSVIKTCPHNPIIAAADAFAMRNR